MTTKHTIAPWTISAPTTYNGIPDAKFEIGTEHQIIATVHGAHYAHTAVNTTEAESNAQLIAAAPELLAALVKVRRYFAADEDSVDFPELITVIDAAIEKATL